MKNNGYLVNKDDTKTNILTERQIEIISKLAAGNKLFNEISQNSFVSFLQDVNYSIKNFQALDEIINNA